MSESGTGLIEALDPNHDTFACPQCGKEFGSKQALNGHVMVHQVPGPCPECGRKLKTSIALARHRNTEHGIEPRYKRGSKPVLAKHDADWKVDDIFQSVIHLLWPGGSMPVTAVVPLLHWREATQEMLEKVLSD